MDGNGVRQDYTEAAKWYREAADQGDVDAQTVLGNLYLAGNGVRQDYTEAAKWYRKAAEQGITDAQTALGHLYLVGNGVRKDYTEAAKWYGKAAIQGNSLAQYELGLIYYYGKGTSISYPIAFQWFSKAAEQENADAELMLGIMFGTGQVEHIDLEKAKRWILKAAEHGNKRAKELYKQLESITEAKASSSGCFITTAVCDALNKPDNCDELVAMRWLRDKLKVEDADMAALIEEYYRIAPLVVRKIDNEADAPLIYRQLWVNYISKIYCDIKQKDYRAAKLRYINMLEDLCMRYNEPLAHGIKEKINRIRLSNHCAH